MNFCSVCKGRIANYTCRRCGRRVCRNCYFHHGICVECARLLGK